LFKKVSKALNVLGILGDSKQEIPVKPKGTNPKSPILPNKINTSQAKKRQNSYEYTNVINIKSYFYIMDSLIYTCNKDQKTEMISFPPDSKKLITRLVKDNNPQNFNRVGVSGCSVTKNFVFELSDSLKKIDIKPRILLNEYRGYYEHIEKFKYNMNDKKLITINDKKTYLWLKRESNEKSESKQDWVLDWSNVDLELGFNSVTANNV